MERGSCTHEGKEQDWHTVRNNTPWHDRGWKQYTMIDFATATTTVGFASEALPPFASAFLVQLSGVSAAQLQTSTGSSNSASGDGIYATARSVAKAACVVLYPIEQSAGSDDSSSSGRLRRHLAVRESVKTGSIRGEAMCMCACMCIYVCVCACILRVCVCVCV